VIKGSKPTEVASKGEKEKRKDAEKDDQPVKEEEQ
jgi:hypothetical protein